MSNTHQQNRLAAQHSPYLLSHAENPVDWYPWGEEAFERARWEDKPIFLSIGYSTCHWCHVMEEESFSDHEVAQLLNRSFVSVKVDREERPDVDALYMSVCQAMTGSGGWPLTILMDSSQRPFYAATYLPKTSRFGSPGLVDVLKSAEKLWRTHREELVQTGDHITRVIQGQMRTGTDDGQDAGQVLDQALELLGRAFDPVYGGFGAAPKFPSPHNLMFLMRYHEQTGDADALMMAEAALKGMYRGGLYDHVGGGFCRYSTDDKWLIPHFEKMLYDNALLLLAYLEAYQITKNPLYRTVAEGIVDYLLRDMLSDAGGFYTAQDADSGGEEGAYYALTPKEVFHVLGREEGAVYCAFYDITPFGNFEGKSIPNLIGNQRYWEAAGRLANDNRALYSYRKQRRTLFTDDKILTSQNGLIIAALARAGRVLDNNAALDAALGAKRFVMRHLYTPSGLLSRYHRGQAGISAFLDDYAFFCWGLLELYDATWDFHNLSLARQLVEEIHERFWDDEEGGFFLNADGQLIVRPKEFYDGATPSGNSVACYCLSKLSRALGDSFLDGLFQKQLSSQLAFARSHPSGSCFFLIALMQALYPSTEVVCVSETAPAELIGLMRVRPLFHHSFLLKSRDAAGYDDFPGFARDCAVSNGLPTYYICKGNACGLPTNDLETCLGEKGMDKTDEIV